MAAPGLVVIGEDSQFKPRISDVGSNPDFALKLGGKGGEW